MKLNFLLIDQLLCIRAKTNLAGWFLWGLWVAELSTFLFVIEDDILRWRNSIFCWVRTYPNYQRRYQKYRTNRIVSHYNKISNFAPFPILRSKTIGQLPNEMVSVFIICILPYRQQRKEICFTKSHSNLREESRYQIVWIFGKVPKGERGSFSIQKSILQILGTLNRAFWAWNW